MPSSPRVLLCAAAVAGLALWQGAEAQSGGGNVIKNDTHFYGQSPPVYPSREPHSHELSHTAGIVVGADQSSLLSQRRLSERNGRTHIPRRKRWLRR